MAPTEQPPQPVWIVEFYHAHFGWLDYDDRFTSREAAEASSQSRSSPYRRRVRQLSSPGSAPAPEN